MAKVMSYQLMTVKQKLAAARKINRKATKKRTSKPAGNKALNAQGV